jgi:phosphate transport system substrate-binding protein
MFKKIVSIAASAAVVAGVLLAAPAQAAGVSIKGSGSSFANNAMQACLGAYTNNTVTYTSTGSGTGKNNFASTTDPYDFGATDSLYSAAPYPTGTYVTVPLLGGPVAFAYTAAKVADGLNLTAQNISDIFTGRVTKWNDASIKANNAKLALPNKTIKVFYRSTSSGTNENISNYLAQNLPGQGWVKSSTWSTAINTARPFTKDAQGNDTTTRAAVVGTGLSTSALVSGTLEDTLNGFGYFDLSDAITADVSVAKLQNKAGAFIAPTASAAAKFINAQSIVTNGTDATNGTLSIDFTKSVSGAYQLSIVTYGVAPRYVPTPTAKVSTNASKLAVGDFFKYVVSSCIPAKAASLGYVALGGALKTSALNQIKTIG